MSKKRIIEDLETHRKRLIYRSWHRGTREMDLILGTFADKYVPWFSAEELTIYQDLLECNDPDLYDWLIGKDSIPANMDSDVFLRLKNHRPY